MPAAVPTVWTIKSLLAWTTNYLNDKGIESPRLEAELLLAHALACKRIDLLVRYDEEPAAAVKASYRELVQRRADRWPTAYLVGTREFFLLPFVVSPAVLIPRPDTETLLMAALAELKTVDAPRVLDLGTGSGILAISVAHKQSTAYVTAADISPDALAIARQNAARHGVAARVRFVQGDLFTAVPEGEQFDAILSNPPYVTTSEWATLDAEVRDHEPKLALDGGPDGLAFYRRIAVEAPRHLKPGGTLLLEIGDSQADAVTALLTEQPALTAVKVVRDAAARPRVVHARRASVAA
jgi:release factor glutamine methyltransferase